VDLQRALAARDGEREGLLARSNGADRVARHPESPGLPGLHASQPGPVVKRPGLGLRLVQHGAQPLILGQGVQRASQRKAEIEGQYPGVARLLQVREGLEGLLEGAHRCAERSALVRPGAGLLTVGHGLRPHLGPQGMVR
jgi:hypothetical protein